MIKIPSNLAVALAANRVSEAEIAEVVNHCESANAKVFDASTGEYTGYKEDGGITLWVRYKIAGGDTELTDCYFNRTKITGDSSPVADANMPLGPLLEPLKDKGLLCCACNAPLEVRKVLFQYMKQHYYAVAFACPTCGQVYESKETVRYRAEKVEALLEGK